MMAGEVISESPETTRSVGQALGRVLNPGEVVAVSGELGAGKTLFIQGLAKGLGTDPRVPVTSPTYTIVHEYPGPKPLFHFDFYRLGKIEEVLALGYEEYFYDDGVSTVEWPEKFPELFPAETLWVNLVRRKSEGSGGDEARRISFSSSREGEWEERLSKVLSGLSILRNSRLRSKASAAERRTATAEDGRSHFDGVGKDFPKAG
jgi:tRNA threonylcarbamoyladenosine biosynthesis protein TsaE